jgi:tRNA G18 (ribose-2'-O)-methylase SpoU
MPLNILPISDPADPRVAEYANLRDLDLRARPVGGPIPLPPHGLFIAEGELVVHRLIASRFKTRSVLTNRSRLETSRPILDRLPESTPVFLVTDALIDGILGFKFHRGILAVGEAGPPLALEDTLRSATLITVLEDLANLDNVGAVFRNTAAFAGPHGAVLLNDRCCDPLYRKAIRTSMGHVLRVPFTTLAPWPAALATLKEAGFTLLALSPRPDAIPLDRLAAAPPPKAALMLGAEGPGLSDAAMAAADLIVRIPIDQGADSLNVAVAAAVALHRLSPL